MTHLTRVIVVDANAIFREGLVKILPEALNLECGRGFYLLEKMRGVGLADLETALILIDWGQNEAVMAIGLARLRQEFPLVVRGRALRRLQSLPHALRFQVWNTRVHREADQQRGHRQVLAAHLPRRACIPGSICRMVVPGGSATGPSEYLPRA